MEGVIINIDLKEKDLPIDSDWHLEPISDAHVGNINCNYTKLERVIKKIAGSQIHSTILLGDNTDNIRHDDKRFNVDAEGVQPITQLKLLRNMFEPIWKNNEDNTKCFGAVIGNHEYNGSGKMSEEEFKREYSYPIQDGGMGLNYLGTLSYIWLNFFYGKEKIRDYRILAAHGSYRGSQSGGELNQMKRLPAQHETFDVYLSGDSHDAKVDKSVLMSPIMKDGKIKLKRRKIWFCSCGTFQETFELGNLSYMEKKHFYARAAETGTITVTFNPYLGKLHAHG